MFSKVSIGARNLVIYGIIVIGLSGLSYLLIQQNARLSANEIPLQLTEDGVTAIMNGESAYYVVPRNIVDISESLSPFVMVIDDSKKVIESSGKLHGGILEIPDGVLDYVKEKGENRITWQPEAGVRIALVARYFSRAKGYPTSGFVVAGKSLREVEKRTGTLGNQTLFICAGLLLLVFIISSRRGFHRPDEQHRRRDDVI